MKHIQLLRHTKAGPHGEGLADRERPLAPRGIRAAGLLADHLRTAAVEPDLVLCSTAVRAVQTLDGIRDSLGPSARVELEDELYGAGAWALLDRLRRLPDDLSAVMVVGHNPGIQELARGLAGDAEDEAALARLAASYPTGGLATLAFEKPWGALDWNRARLGSFVVPRELEA